MKTIEQALKRVEELNSRKNNKFKPSLDNIAGQKAGYIQALKDVGQLKVEQ